MHGTSFNAMPPRVPHILFVLDSLSMRKAGIYAIVRWIITTLRQLRHGENQAFIHISCTSYYAKDAKENNGNQDFVDEHRVNVIYPRKSSLRRNPSRKPEDHVDHINKAPKTFFKADEFKNVTHVVLVSPVTERSDLPHYVHQQTRQPIKLVVLTHLTKVDIVDIRILREWVFDTMFLCVGPKVMYNSIMKTRQLQFTQSVCVFPTLLDFKPSGESKGFSVLTLYNEYNQLWSVPYNKLIANNSKFLDTAAKALGKVARYIKELGELESPHSYVEWCIHWPGPGSVKLVQQLEQLAEASNLTIKHESVTSEQDIATLVGQYTLCLQSGYFDKEGYSGLETMLCGVPTLVLKHSDVSSIIAHTVGADNYHNLTLSNFDVADPSDQWVDVLFDFLRHSRESNHNFQKMVKFLIEYRTGFEVQTGLQDMVTALTGRSCEAFFD